MLVLKLRAVGHDVAVYCRVVNGNFEHGLDHGVQATIKEVGYRGVGMEIRSAIWFHIWMT